MKGSLAGRVRSDLCCARAHRLASARHSPCLRHKVGTGYLVWEEQFVDDGLREMRTSAI